MISRYFSGWTLSDIKNMTSRERGYWIDLIQWRYQSGG